MMVYIYCVANDCIKIVVNSNHVQNLFENDINSNGGVPKKVFQRGLPWKTIQLWMSYLFFAIVNVITSPDPRLVLFLSSCFTLW